MNMTEIRAIAKERGVKAGTMKKSDLVRTIQVAEGNEACFDTNRAAWCGQERCLWKDDCK